MQPVFIQTDLVLGAAVTCFCFDFILFCSRKLLLQPVFASCFIQTETNMTAAGSAFPVQFEQT